MASTADSRFSTIFSRRRVIRTPRPCIPGSTAGTMRSNTRNSLCSSTGIPLTEGSLNLEFTSIPYATASFLTEALPGIPKGSAVYRIFDTRGQLIVLDKTSNLFQRLERYFGERSERVKDLDLREITSRIEFQRTWSPFETAYVLYLQRREHFPKTYRKMRTFRLRSEERR